MDAVMDVMVGDVGDDECNTGCNVMAWWDVCKDEMCGRARGGLYARMCMDCTRACAGAPRPNKAMPRTHERTTCWVAGPWACALAETETAQAGAKARRRAAKAEAMRLEMAGRAPMHGRLLRLSSRLVGGSSHGGGSYGSVLAIYKAVGTYIPVQ